MKVTIRPLEISDALISYKWRNNPIIWKYTGNRPNIKVTPEIESEWIKKVLQNKNEKRFAILVDDNYVGNTYLTDIIDSTAIFHIFIGDENYWGKGVAKEAISLLFLKCKNELGINTIFLQVHPDNVRALLLYKSLGFVEQQQEREHSSLRIKMKKDL